MDLISSYLRISRGFSLHVVACVVTELLGVQPQGLLLTFDLIEKAVRDVLRDPSFSEKGDNREEEVLMYSGLIYESLLTSRMSMQGPSFILKSGLQENIHTKSAEYLLVTLKRRMQSEPGIYEPVIIDLIDQIKLLPSEKSESTVSQQLNPFASSQSNKLPPNEALSDFNSHPFLEEDTEELQNVQDPMETHESMIKFLAHIRKSGMDVVLPQSLHDKLMMALYVAVKVAAPLAHRQLMDMILAAKQHRVLGNAFDTISKTKIRGVLAFLKNSHSIYTSGGNGESVRLFLGKGVLDYRTFREKHDSFINRCIIQQKMFLPAVVKSELVWLGDEGSIAERLLVLQQLEPALEKFFTNRKSQLLPSAFSPLALLTASSNGTTSKTTSNYSTFDRSMMYQTSMSDRDRYGGSLVTDERSGFRSADFMPDRSQSSMLGYRLPREDQSYHQHAVSNQNNTYFHSRNPFLAQDSTMISSRDRQVPAGYVHAGHVPGGPFHEESVLSRRNVFPTRGFVTPASNLHYNGGGVGSSDIFPRNSNEGTVSSGLPSPNRTSMSDVFDNNSFSYDGRFTFSNNF